MATAEQSCAQCGGGGAGSSAIKRCTRCWSVGYCSSQCQRRHWPRHRTHCREAAPPPPPASSESAAASSPAMAPATSANTSPSNASSRWAGLFQTLYQDLWQRARSRAESAFPGVRVSDDLGDLAVDSLDVSLIPNPLTALLAGALPFVPFMPWAAMMPPSMVAQGKCGVAILTKLRGPFTSGAMNGWIVEDKHGIQTRVALSFPRAPPVPPSPLFRPEELEAGHILCLNQPELCSVRIPGQPALHVLIAILPGQQRLFRD